MSGNSSRHSAEDPYVPPPVAPMQSKSRLTTLTWLLGGLVILTVTTYGGWLAGRANRSTSESSEGRSGAVPSASSETGDLGAARDGGTGFAKASVGGDPVADASARSPLHILPWETWKQEIAGKLEQCSHENDADLCISRCLAEPLPAEGSFSPAEVSDRIAYDLFAGRAYVSSKFGRTRLENLLGITSRFLGTGFVLPQGEVEYDRAQLHEYFVPNFEEVGDNAFAWHYERFDRTEETVLGFLKKDASKSKGRAGAMGARPASDFESFYRKYSKVGLLLRVHRFTEKPSGFFGRVGSVGVTFISLSEVEAKGMKISDALAASGHDLGTSPDGNNLPLHVWVYRPNLGEVAAATWTNIRTHLMKWLQDERARRSSAREK